MSTTDRFSRVAITALFLGATLLPAAFAQSSGRPSITSPALNQQIGSASFRISWTGVRGAVSYYLRVRELGSQSYWVNQPMSVSSFTFNPASFNALGTRAELFVYACTGANGTNCGEPSTTTFFIMGPPVVPTSPADNYQYTGQDRRPTFSWQTYTGFQPSSSLGGVTYRISFSGNGAAAETFTTQSTSFTPSLPINAAFQNPVRWAVQACSTSNCSQSAGTRRLNLTGSTFNQLTGNVTLVSPPNGSTVDAGSQLSWSTKPGAAYYKVCLNISSSGCLAIIDNLPAQAGSQQSYTLTADTLNAKPPFGDYYFRGKTMYWGVSACTQGSTSCVGSAIPHRSVQVASAPTGGGTPGGGGDPQVSFSQHLYPIISSPSCGACHPSGSIYPQKTPRPAVCAASCGTDVIPFNTTITAATMRTRFQCMKACSQNTQYSQAQGKVYVVPGNPSQSGLHHKAQASTSAIFSENRTINGVSKPVKEWIRLWIQQGANP